MGAAGGAEPEGYWEGNVDAPTPSTLHGGRVIHVEQVEALLRQGKAVVIDVSNTPRRPAELAPGAPWLPLPHRALPDALWLPGVGAGALTPEVDDFYRRRLERATAGNVDMPLVVYCAGRMSARACLATALAISAVSFLFAMGKGADETSSPSLNEDWAMTAH